MILVVVIYRRGKYFDKFFLYTIIYKIFDKIGKFNLYSMFLFQKIKKGIYLNNFKNGKSKVIEIISMENFLNLRFLRVIKLIIKVVL